MATDTTQKALPSTLAYKPDSKTVTAWFEDLAPTTKDSGRLATLEKIKRLKLTEADLIAQGYAASGLTLAEFMHRALTGAAKSYLVLSGGKKLDQKHASAYKALQKEGETNITPSRLYLKAGTNYRSAERYLLKNGYTWKSAADPNKPRKQRVSAPARTVKAKRKKA